ncbi:MAG TPA: sporulation protein YqfD [Candidatus Cottocaccamicrobium excrementipullorum]|nr:sporulation protein YqfD [Candidatus Cottocaccamicrobium excrementipullorum]
MGNGIRWLGGFIKVKLTGYSPERFFNLCRAKGMEIWNLTCRNQEYAFFISLKDFRQIRPLARKAKVRLRIQSRKGLPFFLQRNRRRKGFAAGMCLFFLLLYSMSLFIWDIQIEGNLQYTDETLMDFLGEQGVRLGMLKAGVDSQNIERALRDTFPDISWTASRVSGTRLLISIRENQVDSQPPAEDEGPRDLVASRAGVVTKVVVRQGTVQVKAGDQVEAGQVLISGQVPIVNDSQEVTAVHNVAADGEVTALTDYQFSESFPLLHPVQRETGKEKKGLSVKIGSFSFVFLPPWKREGNWIYVTDIRQARLFSSFYLPFYWGNIQGKEIETYESFYTKEEMNQKAEGIYQNFIRNLSEKGVQIIQNNVKILEDESVCTVTGSIKASQVISQVQPITEMKETENGKYERSGEHN